MVIFLDQSDLAADRHTRGDNRGYDGCCGPEDGGGQEHGCVENVVAPFQRR